MSTAEKKPYLKFWTKNRDHFYWEHSLVVMCNSESFQEDFEDGERRASLGLNPTNLFYLLVNK